jgi:hypothetical protein
LEVSGTEQVKMFADTLRKSAEQSTATASGTNSDKETVAQLIKKNQESTANYMALNRISNDLFQARMSAAMNMGGGWHYEYRYH